MTDHRDYRASGSWDELEPPAEQEPHHVPWGLGNDLPPIEAHQDPDEIYLCVACWQWHEDQVCSEAKGLRRKAG